MSGTRAGGLKTREKVVTGNPDYYKNIGREGGKVKRPESRHFYMDRELARWAGTKGGHNSSRVGVKNGQGISPNSRRYQSSKMVPLSKPRWYQFGYKRQLKRLGVS